MKGGERERGGGKGLVFAINLLPPLFALAKFSPSLPSFPPSRLFLVRPITLCGFALASSSCVDTGGRKGEGRSAAVVHGSLPQSVFAKGAAQ